MQCGVVGCRLRIWGWPSLIMLMAILSHMPNFVFSGDCDECFKVPLVKDNQKMNVIIHPDDDLQSAIDSACSSFLHNKDSCLTTVTNSIVANDWVPGYLGVVDSASAPMASRHHMFTVSHKLRRFAAPHSLLVIGAPESDSLAWNAINRKAKGGITCFINHIQFDLPEAKSNCPYLTLSTTEQQPQQSQANRIAVSINKGAPYYGIDAFIQLIDFPWDVVVMYPSELCKAEDDQIDLRLSQQQLLIERCDKFVGGVNKRCTSKMLCMQTYFNLGSEFVSDDGYVFVFGSKPQPSATATAASVAATPASHQQTSLKEISNLAAAFRIDFHILETRFLYKHSVAPHMDDSGVALTYYTSQELGKLTLAGRKGKILSESVENSKQFDDCIKETFELANRPNSIAKKESVDSLRRKVLHMLEQQHKRVIGVLFCCRRRYTEVLLPYLRRNLRHRGGVVDHYLVFDMGTEPNDEHYPLQITQEPGFVYGQCSSRLFGCAYSQIVMESAQSSASMGDAIYVKLDDDILFIADGAFEHLVYDKLISPKHTIVHGNGINHMHAPYFHSLLPLMRSIDHSLQRLEDNLINKPSQSFGGGNSEFLSNYLSFEGKYIPELLSSLDEALQYTYLDSLRSALDVKFYDRGWQSAAAANSFHRIFLDAMFGVFDELLFPNNTVSGASCRVEGTRDQSMEVCKANHLQTRAREEAFKFNSIELNRCRCSRPQPGFGFCGATGFYRTTINFVAFTVEDIADHLDLLNIHDEMTMTVLIPEASQVSQVMSGGALYAHAAFTPQRLGDLDEFHIVQRYKELAKLYLV